MANTTLERSACRRLAQDLSVLLANTYIVYVKTQNFHWNVEDPRFYSLHQFFENQYEELAEAVDGAAERIRMLKERAPASLKEFLQLTTLQEVDHELTADEMIQKLLQDHESIISWLRPVIESATQLGDEGTADFLIQRLRAHEKTAWMLRSTI